MSDFAVIRFAETETVGFGPDSFYNPIVLGREAGLPIRTGIQTCDPGYEARMHSHPYVEILHILEGAADVRFEDGDPIRLEAGDTVVLPPDRLHTFAVAGGPADAPARHASQSRAGRRLPRRPGPTGAAIRSPRSDGGHRCRRGGAAPDTAPRRPAHVRGLSGGPLARPRRGRPARTHRPGRPRRPGLGSRPAPRGMPGHGAPRPFARCRPRLEIPQHPRALRARPPRRRGPEADLAAAPGGRGDHPFGRDLGTRRGGAPRKIVRPCRAHPGRLAPYGHEGVAHQRADGGTVRRGGGDRGNRRPQAFRCVSRSGGHSRPDAHGGRQGRLPAPDRPLRPAPRLGRGSARGATGSGPRRL